MVVASPSNCTLKVISGYNLRRPFATSSITRLITTCIGSRKAAPCLISMPSFNVVAVNSSFKLFFDIHFGISDPNGNLRRCISPSI